MLESIRKAERLQKELDKLLGPPVVALSEEDQRLEEEYAKDFRRWLEEQVVTVDEASGLVRPWPRDKPRLAELAEVLQHEQMVAIPKSRRMLASWLCSAFATWKMRFRAHSAAAIQSEKEEKATFFVDQRCLWIENNLARPTLRKPVRTIKTQTGMVGYIEYPNHSWIRAIPQGGSKVRTYTLSLLIMDESEFQKDGPDALVAAKSLIEEAMQIVVLSTSNGPSGILADVCSGVGIVRFPDGAREKRRHRGGWVVVPLHWSSDPRKNPAWGAVEKLKYLAEESGRGEADWRREMEYDFRAAPGNSAYTGFSWDRCTEEGLRETLYDPLAPLVLCCDFNAGFMGWCIGQAINDHPIVYEVIWEKPSTIPSMANKLINAWGTHRGPLWVYGDATGRGKDAQTGRSNYDVLLMHLGHGFPGGIVVKVPMSNPRVVDRINAVNYAFNPAGGRTNALIDREAEWLIRDLQLVTRKGDALVKITDPSKPEADLTHTSDGFGYWIWREWPVHKALEARNRKHRRRGRPQYRRLLGDI